MLDKYPCGLLRRLCLLLTTVLASLQAEAQTPDAPLMCYPVPRASSRPANTSSPNYNPYGQDVTARGELRILIVYAGFTNDIDNQAPDYNNADWPQTDATHPTPGTTFPTNMGGGFYTSSAQFSASATDRTLSNFYYQMSQFGGNPLRMYATIFPKRINVTADDGTSSGGGFFTYTNNVITALANDPDTRQFDFSQVDQRQGNPNFQFDNSVSSPDGVVDYVLVVWRNAGRPYRLAVAPYAGAGGFANVGYANNIPSADGKQYTISTGFTHTAGMSGVSQPLFAHEFAHTFYSSPHYLNANGVVGSHLYSTEGPGMMGYFRTFFAANAWERWFNGWVELKTGANGTNSDIQNASSLAATSGQYILRDYITTGDVMRIRIPNPDPTVNQYVWLENHQGRSVFDSRIDFLQDGQSPSQPFRKPPRGILAMVEGASDSRKKPLSAYGDQGVNGLKVLSAQGNFDTTPSATTATYNNHFYGIPLRDFTNPVANPFGGHNQITRQRVDTNNDGQIFYNPTQGNDGSRRNEMEFSVVKNGSFEDGFLGPDVTFNTVGQKMGLSYNPAIFTHQDYDSVAQKLSPIYLHGLSVELIGKNRAGDITVQVRYDDVDVVKSTRWSGELLVTDVPGAANDADVHVTNEVTLTINKSGTNNRTLLTPARDFINPTMVRCTTGSLFTQDAHTTVSVEGAQTSLQLDNGSQVLLHNAATLVVRSGALLEVKSGGLLTLEYGSQLRVEAGGTLLLRNGAKLGGQGTVQVQDGGFFCPENGAELSTDAVFTLDVAPAASIGVNPSLGLGATNCNSQLKFCGNMPGGNAALSAICPTGNEALLFDGVDDVATIAKGPYYGNHPLFNLGQTFTIEASIRSDRPAGGGGSAQTIFSNRVDGGSGVVGTLFTLYAGKYLLFQMQGQNYYSFSDPLMQVAPNSGCHQVAVSRDNANQLHFYVDGQVAAYAPVTGANPASPGDIHLGGDAPFSPTESFEGQIGELRVWNVARSSADIQRYMASSLPTGQSGLIGYYDLRDVTGQSFTSSAFAYTSGYGNPAGYLGTTSNVDANDPAWVAAQNLTCTVAGNFRRPASGTALPDTIGQAAPRRLAQQALTQPTVSPNPTTGEATLHLQLPTTALVRVSIQDVLGATRLVPLPTKVLAQGAHALRLALAPLAPGVYFVIVEGPEGRKVLRLQRE